MKLSNPWLLLSHGGPDWPNRAPVFLKHEWSPIHSRLNISSLMDDLRKIQMSTSAGLDHSTAASAARRWDPRWLLQARARGHSVPGHMLASLPTTDISTSSLHLCLHIYKFPTTTDILIYFFIFYPERGYCCKSRDGGGLLDTEPKYSCY